MHRGLAVSLLISVTIFPIRMLGQNNGPGSTQLTVAVYNDAGVPVDILRRAEALAAEVFGRAGFEVVWLHCLHARAEDALACKQTQLPEHLALRIIRNSVGRTNDTVFGVAFLAADGSGKYGDVFWKRVQELHAVSNVNLGGILGSVMAHEMGHLLLGSNAHSISGLMRAHWESEELQRIAMGTLVFTPQQAERMHGRANLMESAERRLPNVSDYEANIGTLPVVRQ